MPEFSLARTFRNRGLLLQTGSQFSNSAVNMTPPFFLSKINTNLSKNNKNILQFNYNHAILYSTKQEASVYALRKVWMENI